MHINWTLSCRNHADGKTDDNIAYRMAMLEQEVMDWMSTYQAWDERKHPAILQFIKDIREYCGGPHVPGAVTISAISMELHRLQMKINDPGVDARIAELQRALQAKTLGRK